MLTAPRAQLVEKLITSAEGVVYKAYFLVYEEEGRVKARLVRAVPISKKQNEVVFALAGRAEALPRAETVRTVSTEERIASPYSSLLYFSGSKPRAPSLVI